MDEINRELSVLINFGEFIPNSSEIFRAIFSVIKDRTGLICLQPFGQSRYEATLKDSILVEDLISTGLVIDGEHFAVFPVSGKGVWLKIYGLPHECADDWLLNQLKKFGSVKSKVIREKWMEGSTVFNGTRKVNIELKNALSEEIKIGSYKVRIHYPGISKQCSKCKQTDHLKTDCSPELESRNSSSEETDSEDSDTLSSSEVEEAPPNTVTVTHKGTIPEPQKKDKQAPTVDPWPSLTDLPTVKIENVTVKEMELGAKVEEFKHLLLRVKKLPINNSEYIRLDRIRYKDPKQIKEYIIRRRPTWTITEKDILDHYEAYGSQDFAHLSYDFESYFKEVVIIKEWWYRKKILDPEARKALPLLDLQNNGYELCTSAMACDCLYLNA